MGSYDNIVKLEEIRRKVEEGDLLSAEKILDTMEIKKVKNIADLNLMAEVFAENERYDEAAELYLKIYEKSKTRKAVFQLVDISVKKNNVEDAEYYLDIYLKIAPNDFYKYIFRYKIDKLKGASYEQQIESLETLKKTEYTEQWAYELAKLYYKAGMEKECIRECSDIILWFGEGVYVEKAKMLRSYYSGETDKNKIMDELKRRSEQLNGNNVQSNDDTDHISGKEEIEEEIKEDIEEETEFENYNDNADDSQTILEEAFTSADFSVEQETDDFEDGLKKDIQYMLTNEEDEEVTEEVAIEKEYIEEYVEEEAVEEEFMDEKAVEEEPNNKLVKAAAEPSYEITSKSEKEVAEQEVEDTIYKLLKEEDMNEEDRKLSNIAKELQFNPEDMFGNFLHVISIKKQLVKCLDSILHENTKLLFMIITGTAGSGKTTLAKDFALFLNKAGLLKSSKVAKITADRLNHVELASKKETLRDCCLVIEDASELKRETIDGLLDLSQSLRGNIAVIFEENKKNLNKLFRECPRLMDILKNRIHLPQYTAADLLGFAYVCLKQQDYSLSPRAEVLLKNKVNEIVKQSEQYSYLSEVYELMQSLMNAADLRTGKQLANLASQGRLKDAEILSILPEDFNN